MSIEFEFRVHAAHVELTCTGTYTLESSLQVYTRAFEIAAREDRVALVSNEPMIHPQRFGEVIAKSRGAQARVFTDLDEAMAWISG